MTLLYLFTCFLAYYFLNTYLLLQSKQNLFYNSLLVCNNILYNKKIDLDVKVLYTYKRKEKKYQETTHNYIWLPTKGSSKVASVEVRAFAKHLYPSVNKTKGSNKLFRSTINFVG